MSETNEERKNIIPLNKQNQESPVITQLNNLPSQVKAITSQSFAPMALVFDKKTGKTNKFPINPTNGEFIKWKKEPDKILTLSATMQFLKIQNAENIKRLRLGILLQDNIFGDNTDLLVIDIDHRKDLVEQAKNQNITSTDDQALIVKFALEGKYYIEVSQSGEGLHILFKGNKHNKQLIRNDKFEYYCDNRWLCLTGNSINQNFSGNLEITDRKIKLLESVMFTQEERERSLKPAQNVKINNEKFDDKTIDTIIYKAEHAKNSAYFIELFSGSSPSGDTSSDDLAFCNLLAFWTKKNPTLMDAIFRKSKRMREKWDEVHSADGKTYGEMTIEKAIAVTSEVYHEKTKTAPKEVASAMTDIKPASTSQQFKSMHELFDTLSKDSMDWCIAHKDKAGNPATLQSMPNLEKLKIIVNREPLAIVVSDINDTKETKTAPLHYYDWDTGLYSTDQGTLESMILAVDPNITSTKTRINLIDTIRRSPQFKVPVKQLTQVEDLQHRYIAVGNGVFDQKEMSLHPYEPSKWFFTSKIGTPLDYTCTEEPNFNGWTLSGMIKKIATNPDTGEILSDKEDVLWKTLKASILGAFWLRKSVILVDNGDGSSGKSTYTDIIANTVGKQNVANLRLADLQDPTRIIEATSSNVIIGDDNDPEVPISKFDNFNTIVSSDPLRVRNYYRESYSTRIHCFMIQNANGIPPLSGAKTAVFNRLIAIDFKTKFDASKKANWLVKNDYIHRDEFKKWLLYYLLTHVELGITLPETRESKHLLQKVRETNDTVYAFAKDVLNKIPADAVPSNYLYALYHNYSLASGEPLKSIVSRKKFMIELQKKEEFKRNWNYKPRNLKIKDINTFIDKTKEGTCASLISHYEDILNNVRTLSADVSNHYTGSGIYRLNDNNQQ